MEPMVKEIVKRVFGKEYENARGVKVYTDGVSKMRKAAAEMGPAYVDALERAIKDKAVQVNLTSAEISHLAARLTEGMEYIAEERDYQVDWLSDEIAAADGESVPVRSEDESGDIEGMDNWLRREL